ncbi:MAG: PilZ domain-containing protein [Candidatus Omnitrophica bacterium]|nr:PilZ domain-containing protein [Candidatus Omnitrophota bacterium]
MNEPIENSDEPLGSSFEDRRLFERFPSRFPAKFKDTRGDFGADIYLRDASAGGVKITTKERLYLNDKVTLEVDMSDGKGDMTLRGAVAWVKNKETEMWDIGIRFHKIVFMDMWRPYKFIETDSAA